VGAVFGLWALGAGLAFLAAGGRLSAAASTGSSFARAERSGSRRGALGNLSGMVSVMRRFSLPTPRLTPDCVTPISLPCLA
jgi:hypothetical protein